ncbi:MAG: oligosaccharide flippase family protein [Bryobacteraceae bacterium]
MNTYPGDLDPGRVDADVGIGGDRPSVFRPDLGSAGGVRILSESFWVFSGQALSASGAVFAIRVLSRKLLPETYGALALGLSVAALSQALLYSPIGQAALRYYSIALEEHSVDELMVGMLSLLAGSVAAVTVGLAATSGALLLCGRGELAPLLCWTCFFSIVNGFGVTLDALQSALRQRRIVAFHQGLLQWLRPLLAVGALGFVPNSTAAAMAGYAAASVVVFASQIVFFYRAFPSGALKAHIDFRHRMTGRLFGYAWPLIVMGVPTWLLATSDRWAIATLAGAAEVGLYAVAFQFGYYPISMAANIAVVVFSPILFLRVGATQTGERLRSALKLNWRVFLASLGLTAVATVGALVTRGPVFRLVVGPHYQRAMNLWPILVVAGGLAGSSEVIKQALLIWHPQPLLRPRFACAAIGISLNCGLGYKFGSMGVSIAVVLTQALHTSWLAALVHRREKGNSN